MMDDELAYGISKEAGVRKTLSNMRSFKGDEQLPNKSLFGDSGTMGGAMGMDRRGSQQRGRRIPAKQADRGMRQQRCRPRGSSTPKEMERQSILCFKRSHWSDQTIIVKKKWYTFCYRGTLRVYRYICETKNKGMWKKEQNSLVRFYVFLSTR